MTLSWADPANMSNVTKTYFITYWKSASPSTQFNATSNTTNVILPNLTPGMSYSISVVTVGVQAYQSTPVIGSVYTSMGLSSFQYSLIWLNVALQTSLPFLHLLLSLPAGQVVSGWLNHRKPGLELLNTTCL